MKINVAQLAIGRDISRNQAKVLEVLEAVEPGEWVVFPEGVLSGYFPGQSGFLQHVVPAAIEGALDEIAARVRDRGCRCILGSATCVDGNWRNSAVVLGPAGERLVYHKRALSALDQRHFVPGKDPLVATWDNVTLGILICRELAPYRAHPPCASLRMAINPFPSWDRNSPWDRYPSSERTSKASSLSCFHEPPCVVRPSL